MRKIVRGEEGVGRIVRHGVEAHGQVGEACDARECVGACGLEHELEELQGVVPDAQHLGRERLPDAEAECGQRGGDHR